MSDESPRVAVRRQLVLLAIAVFVALGAIAIVGVVWIVNETGPAKTHGRSSFALATQVRAAQLGCDESPDISDSSNQTFPNAVDEVDCTTMVIARFEHRDAAATSIHRVLCSDQRVENRTYVLGDYWLIYPDSARDVSAISAAVGGSVRQACS